MTTSARTPRPKPAPKSGPVDLDLDALEAEHVPDEPFYFRYKGRRIGLKPPGEYDWQVAASINARNPHMFFAAAMTEEDFDFFCAQPVTEQYKIETVVTTYRDKFGLEEAPAPN